MKAKTLSFLIAGIFALALLSFASAVTISSVPELSRTDGSFDVTISSASLNDSITLSINDITRSGKTIDFTLNESSFTLNNDSRNVRVTYDIPSDFDFSSSTTTNLIATSSSSSNASQAISFSLPDEPSEITSCSVIDSVGNLDLEIRDVNVVSGYSADDNEWYPRAEIEVEVRMENNGNDDLENLQLEWGLWSEDSNDWIIEPVEEDEFDIRDDDEETITFTFGIDGDLDIDFDELEDGNYVLYVWANGKVDTTARPDTCDSDSFNARILIDKDFVILSDLEIPQTISCNSNVLISGELWNIGSRDQNDVSVRITSSLLGIDEIVQIGDIDSLDNSDFNFNFDVGSINSGTAILQFSVLDEDDDIFENDNDDLSQFRVNVLVSGCSAQSNDVDVNAVLESGGKAGRPLVVRATITNSGNNTATFTLSPSGYASWADSAQLSQNSVTLNAGSSQDVLVTLDVKKDALGEEEFSLEVLSGSQMVASQPVSVTIRKGSFFSNLINRDNWQIWGIGLLNLILVIVIIIVAIRLSRK